MPWRIVTYRLSGEESRHRVSVWRELRRVGAVAVQSGTWVIPTGDGFDEGLVKAVRLVERAAGHVLVLDVAPDSGCLDDLERLYTAGREAEWVEFVSECDMAAARLGRGLEHQKLTLAELGEEEHDVQRLRRWYRELRAKDLFGAPSAVDADAKLRSCTELLEEFAQSVYEARQRA